MRLVPVYCAQSPGWHDLPAEGVPDRVWGYGRPHPPADVSLADVRVPLDYGHDYVVVKDRFRYMYSGGDDMWLLFQYGTETTARQVGGCSECGAPFPEGANFCGMCGEPVSEG